MTGLNFLLWTIAVILILGVVVMAICTICALCVRIKAIKEFKNKPTIWDKLENAKLEREEMIRRQREAVKKKNEKQP